MHANLILDPIFIQFWTRALTHLSALFLFMDPSNAITLTGGLYQNKYLRLNLLSGWLFVTLRSTYVSLIINHSIHSISGFTAYPS